MSDTLYNVVRLLGRPFRYRVIGLEHIQPDGPAIFIANHLASAGPLQVILSVPVRFYPWAIAEMTDRERAAAYLYDDFIRPVWRLSGPLGLVVSALVARIAVRLINGLGAVAVERNRGWVRDAFRDSLALLLAGKKLLIFPEDPAGPLDPTCQMRPFLCGFLLLCSLYQKATGQALPIYPTVVHAGCKTVAIGQAVYPHLAAGRREDIRRVCGQLRQDMAALYQLLQP